MERYSVGLLIGVSVVVVISIIGGEKVSGSVLSSGFFEDAYYENLEGVSPREDDPLGV